MAPIMLGMRNPLKRLLRRKDPLHQAAVDIDRGRAGIEALLGLPHRLAVPLLERHFGGDAIPSDPEFRETGRNGHWTLPPPAHAFEARLFGDTEGRLTCGTIRGLGQHAGLEVFSEWSPEDPAAVWQLRLDADATDSARTLHDYLLHGATSADPRRKAP